MVAFAVSLPLTRGMMAVGERLGHMDKPGAESHKAHARAVPKTGGVAIVAAVAGPMVLALAAVWGLPGEAWSGALEPLADHVPGLRGRSMMAGAVLAAMAALHVLGLIDDRRGLGPGVKLTVQAAVALALAAAADMRVLTLLDGYGPAGWWLSVLVSTLWLVVVINVMNMMDNMDGLAAGVGAVIAGLYLAVALVAGQWFVAATAGLLLGALGGFLVYNAAPARVFMGDAGSLVVGLLLGVVSVRTTYLMPSGAAGAVETGAAVSNAAFDALTTSGGGGGRGWHAVLMPLVVFAVPLYDAASVTVLRLSQGRSPLVGDNQHFSHRLVERGMRPAMAVGVIWLCTLATGLGGMLLPWLAPWQAVVVALQTAAVLTVLALVEWSGRGKWEK